MNFSAAEAVLRCFAYAGPWRAAERCWLLAPARAQRKEDLANRITDLSAKNVSADSGMTDDEEWLNASAALIAYTVPDPKPLAELLRSRKEIPAATILLLADLLDPPPVAPLGMRLKMVDNNDPAINLGDDPASAPEHESTDANAYETTDNESWQGPKVESAKIICRAMLKFAKRYVQYFVKWLNHDI